MKRDVLTACEFCEVMKRREEKDRRVKGKEWEEGKLGYPEQA